MVNHFVELLRGHVFGLRKIRDKAGIEVAGARAHGHARGRREPHAGIDALAVAHRGETRPIAQMGQHDFPQRRFRAGCAGEFFHEMGIRQAVEAVALDARGLIASRDGQDLRNARHMAMESRVEARHLRQARRAFAEQIDHGDFGGQMLRRVSADAAQFIEQRFSEQLRLVVAGAAVDNAMAYRADRIESDALLQPVEQKPSGRRMIAI